MKLVVDANVVISALISKAKTRELIVTLEADLLTPAIISDEIEQYEPLIVEKSGLNPDRVQQFISLLFEHIDTVPVPEFASHISTAETAIGDTDPDDVLYVACALGCDGAIWSDDTDFESQDLLPVYTTADVVNHLESK